jgi:hypothetical protein
LQVGVLYAQRRFLIQFWLFEKQLLLISSIMPSKSTFSHSRLLVILGDLVTNFHWYIPVVRALDDWAASHTLSLPLSSLKGAVLGIDASHYIHEHHSTREPLLIALGGFPFALRNNIEQELQTFKNLGIACVFVFDGLEFGKREPQAQARAERARAFEQAWDLYDQQQADQVVDAFSNAGKTMPTCNL